MSRNAEFLVRKLILFMLVSLDGFYEGPGHTLDWHNVEAEFNEFASALLNSVDMLLFSRRAHLPFPGRQDR